MEVLFALPVLLLPLMFPLLAGMMAINFGRRFWPWVFIGLALPMVANIILLCLPDKTKRVVVRTKPVENDELFDHLFTVKKGAKPLKMRREVLERA